MDKQKELELKNKIRLIQADILKKQAEIYELSIELYKIKNNKNETGSNGSE